MGRQHNAEAKPANAARANSQQGGRIFEYVEVCMEESHQTWYEDRDRALVRAALARVVSAHRSPEAMIAFGRDAAASGYDVIIAAAEEVLPEKLRIGLLGEPLPNSFYIRFKLKFNYYLILKQKNN